MGRIIPPRLLQLLKHLHCQKVSKNLVFKKNLSHSLKKISVSLSKTISVSVPMKILVSSLSEPKVRSAVLGKVRQEKIGDIAFP